MNAACNFEYEWIIDGSLRVRFMNEENAIVGQQFIAAEGLAALHLLISLAIAKNNTSPEDHADLLRKVGIDADREFATLLREATRVRTGITPEGDIRFDVVDED